MNKKIFETAVINTLDYKAKQIVQNKKTSTDSFFTQRERLVNAMQQISVNEAATQDAWKQMTPTQKKTFIKVFSDVAGKSFSPDEDLVDIVNSATKVFAKGRHSPDLWNQYGDVLNHVSSLGIKWNKDLIIAPTRKAMGIK